MSMSKSNSRCLYLCGCSKKKGRNTIVPRSSVRPRSIGKSNQSWKTGITPKRESHSQVPSIFRILKMNDSLINTNTKSTFTFVENMEL